MFFRESTERLFFEQISFLQTHFCGEVKCFSLGHRGWGDRAAPSRVHSWTTRRTLGAKIAQNNKIDRTRRQGMFDACKRPPLAPVEPWSLARRVELFNKKS